MRKKKSSLTSTQRFGIIWITAALALMALVAFFCKRPVATGVEMDSITTPEVAFLAQKEDSVYKSQRKAVKNNYLHDKNRLPLSHEAPPEHIATQPPSRKQPLMVELNSADTLTLQLLSGIGSKRAAAIVRYRERLGGFCNEEQLLEVYSIDSALLQRLRPYLRVDTTLLHRIVLDSISLKELARHPYVEYYQARDIVRLRDQGVRFRSVDDLRAVPSMADSTLSRLLPYLDF